jgi:transaldolase
MACGQSGESATTEFMSTNPLKTLAALGQSVWLDYIQREMLSNGQLRRLIEEYAVTGVTSNPAIFNKAIAGSGDYDGDIHAMATQGQNVKEIYDTLSIDDVQRAAGELHSVFVSSDGHDGYVSLEVDPHLAHDTQATVADARRLWTRVDRPNLLIKVPATEAGLPAIQRLISEGINVNVTLLFGLSRYRQVTEAYLSGIEARASRDLPLKPLASVASFFVSRIDSLLDPRLEASVAGPGAGVAQAAKLCGKVAIANAKLAFQLYKEIFAGQRYQSLAEQGARSQRLLWASTSTKNPAYSDVKYVEALIGPDTVNTLPLETLGAYRDHGDPRMRLEDDIAAARLLLDQLPELGIDIDQAARQLEDQGVGSFVRLSMSCSRR